MDNLPATLEPIGNAPPTGIFLQAAFPSNTKPCEFTPQQLWTAIHVWAATKSPLDDICKQHHLRTPTVYHLIEQYPEIRNVYEVARKMHAGQMVEKARNQYNQPPDEAYFTDKWGNRQLSQSWVTYNRDKSNMLLRLAQIYETGTTIQRTQVQQESVSYNINIHSKAPSEVANQAGNLEQLLADDAA